MADDLEEDLNFDGETTEGGVKVKRFKAVQATCKSFIYCLRNQIMS